MSQNPLVSQRLPIGKALVSLLGAVQNPNTSAALYSLVQLGAVFNPSNDAIWCEITHFSGQGKPIGSGGSMTGWRIEDEVIFLLTSGIGPYETDPVAAQTNMLMVQDIVLPALHTHFQLPDSTNMANALASVYEVLPIQIDRSRPARFPNGHWYNLWSLPVIVKQQYTITFSSP